MPDFWEQPGSLVALPARGAMLDGFWRHEAVRRPRLLILVHGMGSDFYHSRFKKTLLERCPEAACDGLSFNNRGSREGVRSERFTDCLRDLDAALAFGRRQGYRRFVLAGHSTGCQKIAYHQFRRNDPAVEALVHLAPGDDYAITLRELGPARLRRLVEQLHARVKAGRGDEAVPSGGGLPEMCEGFTARRFLSIADPAQTEAGIFQYDGKLRVFSKLTLPQLVVFGTREEYACLPMSRMAARLREKTSSSRFAFVTIRGADHGFHRHEREAAGAVMKFLKQG
jgi:pimeloyl-ACP methyl ester carboxylesterase